MIQIKVETKESIQRIVIKGHAMYDDIGKDIVCAGVSAIVTTTVNALLRLGENIISYEAKSGYVEIKVCKKDSVANLLLENMVDLLHELNRKYKKNIKIEEVPL